MRTVAGGFPAPCLCIFTGKHVDGVTQSTILLREFPHTRVSSRSDFFRVIEPANCHGFSSKITRKKRKKNQKNDLFVHWHRHPFFILFHPDSSPALLLSRDISEPIRQALTGLERRPGSNNGWWLKHIEMATKKSDFTHHSCGLSQSKLGFVWRFLYGTSPGDIAKWKICNQKSR